MLKFVILILLGWLPQLLFSQIPIPFKKEILPCVWSWDLRFKQDRIVNLEATDDSLFIHLSVLEDCRFGGEC